MKTTMAKRIERKLGNDRNGDPVVKQALSAAEIKRLLAVEDDNKGLRKQLEESQSLSESKDKHLNSARKEIVDLRREIESLKAQVKEAETLLESRLGRIRQEVEHLVASVEIRAKKVTELLG